MAKYDFDIGILGGGAAGLSAASGSAQFGARTILIEKSNKLGGDCLHFGCVPSKTLIRTAGVRKLGHRFHEFGLPDIDIARVDLAAVMERVHSVIEKIQVHDSPERFRKLGADVRFGNPEFINDHELQLNGEKISAKSWIIATGSRPSPPPVDGLEHVPYWTNETVFSQKELPQRLLVLGGGPIGLELAQAFQRLGSQVTVIEYIDQILCPEDSDIAEILKKRLEQEGLEILIGTKAVKAEANGSTIRLTVAPAKEEEKSSVIEGDALLIAAGRKPNIEDIGLKNAGVISTPRGITTNAKLKTNISHIYACGDINGQLPFTHVAGYEAGLAITNAVLHIPRSADYRKVPWCTYTDPEVASIGLNEKRSKQEGVEYRVLEEEFIDNDRALAEAESLGKIKILISPRSRILGCQIIGSHAGELIHEWVAAINGGVKLSTMAGMIHAYPTLSEISKRVAGAYYSEKLFSKKTRNLLRFLFRYRGSALVSEKTKPIK